MFNGGEGPHQIVPQLIDFYWDVLSEELPEGVSYEDAKTQEVAFSTWCLSHYAATDEGD